MDGFPCFHVHPFFTIIIINDNDDDNGETKLNLIEYNEKQNEKKTCHIIKQSNSDRVNE